MKNMTKIISAFAFLMLLGSYALKAQCTIVLKPNVMTQSTPFLDQTIQLSSAINACNATGKIEQIIIKYHNSLYNGNSLPVRSIRVNIGEANNAVIALTASQDSTVKGSQIAGPAQNFTETLTYLGSDVQQYLPSDTYIEIKGFIYSGSTTSFLINTIDEIDIITAP